jgi:diguanylate cyclase (GGDEF)-like protein
MPLPKPPPPSRPIPLSATPSAPHGAAREPATGGGKVARGGLAATTGPSADPALPPGVSLRTAGALLGVGSGALAALAAYGAASLLGPWSAGHAPSVAALAAALGVAVGAVPLGFSVARLLREIAPGGSASVPGEAPSAGMNRELFMVLAEREWARARRYGSGAALLLVDIDRLARLTETRGPSVGADVVNEALRLTAPTLRTADALTHFSDGQMAVFLAHADATGALDVAERIRERTEQMELAYAHPTPAPLRVTVSIGVAHLRPAHLNLQALIDDAHEAVAAARAAGGNCVRAAPVVGGRSRSPGAWRGDERRAQPKSNGPV